MRILSHPDVPEPGGRRRRGRIVSSEPAAGLMARIIRTVAEVQEYYENMRVEDWGKLPDPVKLFLQKGI